MAVLAHGAFPARGREGNSVTVHVPPPPPPCNALCTILDVPTWTDAILCCGECICDRIRSRNVAAQQTTLVGGQPQVSAGTEHSQCGQRRTTVAHVVQAMGHKRQTAAALQPIKDTPPPRWIPSAPPNAAAIGQRRGVPAVPSENWLDEVGGKHPGNAPQTQQRHCRSSSYGVEGFQTRPVRQECNVSTSRHTTTGEASPGCPVFNTRMPTQTSNPATLMMKAGAATPALAEHTYTERPLPRSSAAKSQVPGVKASSATVDGALCCPAFSARPPCLEQGTGRAVTTASAIAWAAAPGDGRWQGGELDASSSIRPPTAAAEAGHTTSGYAVRRQAAMQPPLSTQRAVCATTDGGLSSAGLERSSHHAPPPHIIHPRPPLAATEDLSPSAADLRGSWRTGTENSVTTRPRSDWQAARTAPASAGVTDRMDVDARSPWLRSSAT